jgi:hypothetical protein
VAKHHNHHTPIGLKPLERYKSEEFLDRLRALPRYFKIRPNTGKLWLDCVYLTFLVAVQFTIFPSLFGEFILVDVVTPWLVYSFVRTPNYKFITLALVATLALETHNAGPRGLYFCIYWVIGAVIFLMRETLSWRHFVPWLFTFADAEIWLVLFEGLVIGLSRDSSQLNAAYCFAQFLRIIIATSFGAFLVQYFYFHSREEFLTS